MKWLKFVLAAAFALGPLAADTAWADRGRGGGHHFRDHDAYKPRYDGHGHHRGKFKPFHHDGRAYPVHRRGRGRSHFGLFIGAPLWYWPPPYYYPPPVVIRSAPPPVYIERDPEPPAEAYWYYCYDPDGYYPYVKECPGGWERVSPTPPR